jgi:HlyD family secretion protein
MFALEDGRARVRPVAIGPSDGQWTAIERGIGSGDEVVAQPSDAIRDGTRATAIPRLSP